VARERAPARTKPTAGQTRETLLDAARAVFTERGFAATRVADIVARAGTSHGTFYIYFDDKRDVLLALAQRSTSAIFGAAVAPLGEEPEGLRDAIRMRIGAFCRAFSEHWGVVQTLNQASGIHDEVTELRSRIRAGVVSAMAELMTTDRDKGLVRDGVDLEIAAVALAAMVEEFAARWLAAGRTLGEHEVEQLTDLWLRAVYPEHGP